MKRWNRPARLGGLAAAILALTAGVVIAAEKEQEIAIDQLPAAVKATAEANAQGGTLAEAELEEENGQQIYSVEIKAAGGGEIELEIAPDGKLLTVEKEDDDDEGNAEEEETKIELSQAPAAVQTAIGSFLKDGAELKTVTREKEGGREIFEAEYTVAGVAHSLELGANGAVLEQENEVSTSTLPAEVSAALQKKFPKGEIREAEEVTVRFYEFEIKQGGKSREVKVLGNGQIVSGDDDDDEDEDEDDD